MRRHGSTKTVGHNNYMRDDEEGLLYDENQGFNISPRQRRKKSSFAPQKSRYIQHFPGGYKIESEVPAGTPVPFQAPPMAPFGTPMPGFGTPYPGVIPPASPYHFPPTHPYYGGAGYPGYFPNAYGNIAGKGFSLLIYIANSYQQFVEFIDQRDKMKEHLDKQTESLNSLKNEIESLKKDEHEFGEKIRHGKKQIIPITRSKR